MGSLEHRATVKFRSNLADLCTSFGLRISRNRWTRATTQHHVLRHLLDALFDVAGFLCTLRSSAMKPAPWKPVSPNVVLLHTFDHTILKNPCDLVAMQLGPIRGESLLLAR